MEKSREYAIGLNWKTVFYPLLTLLIIFAAGWLVYELRQLITVLIIAFIISYLLEPFASILEGKGLSRGVATLIIFFISTLFIVVLVGLIIPPIIEQFERLQSAASSGRIDVLLQNLEDRIAAIIPADMGINVDIREGAAEYFAGISSGALDFAISFLSTLSVAIIIPVAVFFFIKDGIEMKKGFVQVIPNKYFEMTLNIIHKIDLQLGGYLRGLLIDASVIAILASIGLWIIGSPSFVVVGIFAGLANMIPYVGPLAGALAAIVVNFMSTGNFDQTLPIVVVFAIVQLIDNAVVQPLVISKNVAIHPVTIIIAILIGGQFFGLIGMFIAVPVASILKVTSVELYRGIQKYV